MNADLAKDLVRAAHDRYVEENKQTLDGFVKVIYKEIEKACDKEQCQVEVKIPDDFYLKLPKPNYDNFSFEYELDQKLLNALTNILKLACFSVYYRYPKINVSW